MKKFRDLLLELSLEDHHTLLTQQKDYSDLEFDSYLLAASLDPTTRNNQRGKYVQWIIKNAHRISKSWDGDISSTLQKWIDAGYKNYFEKYLKIPNKKDINQIESLPNFIRYVNTNYQLSSKEQKKNEKEILTAPDDIKIIDILPDWIVAQPLTWNGSQKLACYKTSKGADWCTARQQSSDHFDDYTTRGMLVIFINKNDPSVKYQIFINKYGIVKEAKSFNNIEMDRSDAFDLLLMSKNISDYTNVTESDKVLQIELQIYDYVKNDDGTITCPNDVTILKLFSDKLPVKFKRVFGKFKLHNLVSLTTLEGCPEFCKSFVLNGLHKLTSLEGGPKRVEEYDVSWCGLTSLKGCPETAVNVFSISFCPELNVLDYAPQGEVKYVSINLCGEYFEQTSKSEIRERLKELGCDAEEDYFA